MAVRQSQFQVAVAFLAIVAAFAPSRPSARDESVRVVLPDDPPRLSSAAALALLRILLENQTQGQADGRAGKESP
jgi:hypothetical protein